MTNRWQRTIFFDGDVTVSSQGNQGADIVAEGL
jgi:hypothetical protein